MKQYLAMLLLFVSSSALAQEVDQHAHVKNGFIRTVLKFESAILKLNRRLGEKKATRLATLIAIETKKSNLDPRLVLAIINAESSFNQKALNKNKDGSLDVSIAQINTRAWNPRRFKEEIGQELNTKRLRVDEAYAISRMCMILSYLKRNFSDHDKLWFARYHSATPQYKKAYMVKLTKTFKTLKPLGKDLLKEMPPIEHLVEMRSFGNNEVAMATYLER